MDRRTFSISTGAGLMAATLSITRGAAAATPRLRIPAHELKRVEKESGGRLGVMAVDTGSGTSVGYRAAERFPICSTFKLLAAGALLAQIDHGAAPLETRVRYTQKDVVDNSPVTALHVGDGMTLAALCEAAITRSDNTAGNLILKQIDGLPKFNAFARSLGDSVTRLDRYETELNTAIPGDLRDTTTPAAMAENLRKLVLTDVLSAPSRQALTQWLLDSKTSATRMRAGFPVHWRVGDKTGSGDYGSTNDLGIIWPPEQAPLLLSIYLTNTKATPERRNAAIAEVARLVAGTIG
ncbi:MAG: beta-lactamase [Betaproteobacteria bacterium]|nr:beta-lactamase [Betaproteobacteria bacterium]